MLKDEDIFTKYIELTGDKPPPITETTRQLVLDKINDLEKSKILEKASSDPILIVDDDLFALNILEKFVTFHIFIVLLSSQGKNLVPLKIDSPIKLKPVSTLINQKGASNLYTSPVKVTQISMSQPVITAKSPKKSLMKTPSLSTPVKSGPFNSIDVDIDNDLTPPSPSVSSSSSDSPQQSPTPIGVDNHRVRHLPGINKPGHYRSFRRNSISRPNFDPYDDMVIVGPEELARRDAKNIFSRFSKVNNSRDRILGNNQLLRLGLGFAFLLFVGSALYYFLSYDPFYSNPIDNL
ncbi:hypothetical protein Ciccas_004775 [Cichlidogyrus casuarinus]|uniref:Uncharacterized protein n=1 Tax=Cichlidogyrus casuarinus TaxID=1844966 RepID=A0ABD2QCU2_9PLAT